MNIRKLFVTSTILGSFVFLNACSEQKPAENSDLPHRSLFKPEVVALGKKLYAQNCAQCHRDDASGTPSWRTRVNGKFPPPPLNGTAHTWHHPTAVLKDLIFNGTAATGGDMPAWRGKLTESDVEAILSWLQTLWPDRAYEAWLEIEQRSKQPL